MPERPLIGVLPLLEKDALNYWITPNYMHGLEAAGATPVLLMLTPEKDYWQTMCRRMDGFLFPGGPDIAPPLYGQQTLPQCQYQAPQRDTQEVWMLRQLLDANKPVLGICRGCQLLNVVMGGTLYQDLPSQHPSAIAHNQAETGAARDARTHLVHVTPGSRLQALTGASTLSVNSLHHQAVQTVAPGLRAAATAPDGVVESVESLSHRFALGVQWHPEFLWSTAPEMLAIFRGLVESC